MRTHGFIFHDAKGGRWGRFKFLAFAGALVSLVALVLFLRSLLITPKIDSPTSLKDLKLQIRANERAAHVYDSANSKKVLSSLLSNNSLPRKIRPPKSMDNDICAAFFSGWDEAAFQSWQKNSKKITHVCPEWLSFTDMEKGISVEEDAGLERLAKESGTKLFPVLTNLDDSKRISEGVEFLAQAGAPERKAFITQLSDLLKNAGASGVVIDWEEVDGGDGDELTSLLIEIADALKAQGLETWLCITMDAAFNTWNFEKLSFHVSRFIGLVHDEHGEMDLPGPIASQDWFEGWLQVIAQSAVKPEQWIISIACHGSDWTEGVARAEPISFADAMSRAGNAGCSNVKNEGPSFNGNFSYYYNGKAHEVWFLDAVSFANQRNAVKNYGFGGVILNRMGIEDPVIWKMFTLPGSISVSNMDTLIPGGHAITSIGEGEMVSLDPTVANGRREFSQASDGRISCVYQTFPAHPTLFRLGAGAENEIALTFDDGPDPDWTPAILDILKARGVKATFFVVGKEAERYPEILQRIVSEGHEIGNHSYTHPNLAEIPEQLIKLELNATQRLIESLTGLSTVLFRPPYNADSRPTKLQELVPINVAQSMGYITVLENVDPRDWQVSDRAMLLERIKESRKEGNILLLHDGGGDRSATVEALPALLDYLQERGDKIVSVASLLGVDPQKVMPPVTSDNKSFEYLTSGIGFDILRAFQNLIESFLLIGTVLVVGRTVLVLFLARFYKAPEAPSDFIKPSVSVIIPAFNEDKVIAKTIESLLASDYPNSIEVVVVDDGSTDGTAVVVESIEDPRVRLLRQVNSGKAHALQRAVDLTESEILIFVDADTQFQKDALSRLVESFHNKKVGAVSGHARVGNCGTFLARCQDLEYISGFNLDRRAYAVWNCITVAPGAISAIRRDVILAAGGFSFETLAEDTDLTLAIHKTGYTVEYQPKAVAYTEAPETFSALAKQRFRWAFGTLQCVVKHSDMLFNPRYKALGFFSLPGILFFQVVLVAISPFIDILFLQSLIFGHADDILPYFVAFMICDVILASVACRLEGLPIRVALRIIPQRFIYRPLLGYVIWKSLIHAIRGAWVGWGKLQRTATVSVP